MLRSCCLVNMLPANPGASLRPHQQQQFSMHAVHYSTNLVSALDELAQKCIQGQIPHGVATVATTNHDSLAACKLTKAHPASSCPHALNPQHPVGEAPPTAPTLGVRWMNLSRKAARARSLRGFPLYRTGVPDSSARAMAPTLGWKCWASSVSSHHALCWAPAKEGSLHTPSRSDEPSCV